MKYENILITGSSGKIGKALLSSELGKRKILAPSRDEMDITNDKKVSAYFEKNKIDAVIHCAAMTNGRECEKNPESAIKANVIGASNVVQAALKSKARFIYMSTDYVYPCVKGPYSEKDETNPFTVYGWTKLEGEYAVKKSENYCVIRTSLLDTKKITFDTAPTDAYVSKIPLEELVEAIIFLLDSNFVGIINVGRERASLYDIYKKYKPDIKPVSIKSIPKEQQRAVDSSLDITLWKEISKKDSIK